MSRKSLDDIEKENGLVALADIIRNGEMVVHKHIKDAQKSLDKARHRIEEMNKNLQALIDNERTKQEGREQ